MASVTDRRNCVQCGTLFVPRREHARFCSAGCRVAWNRERGGDPAVKLSALQWSISGMSDTADRLARVNASDQPQALALLVEAVWSVTIVDAALVRYHAETYDAVMADQTPVERRLMEETLAGLRFVRNRIGDEVNLDEFIEPGAPGPGADERPVTDWTWRSVPEPAFAWLSPRARSWEMTRYRAYQAQLAGRTIGEIFGRAVAFLELAAANAPSITDIGAHAGS
jgi:hypothetical protein